MTNEKSFEEILFILFCGLIVAVSFYYVSKQPIVESWNIYISGTIQDNRQTNWTKTGEKTAWNTDLNVGENQDSLIKLRTWSIEPTHSKPIQSLQLMSKDVRVYVKGFPTDSFANNVATYAYWISSWDIDFLATLKAENWAFDMYLQSRVPVKWWPNGREDARWLCQLHRTWHWDIVNDKRFWNDRKRQLEQCYKKYKWWTKFYWKNVRHKYLNDFTIINK